MQDVQFGRHYMAGEWLVQARAATRAKKVTTDPFAGESGDHAG